MLTFVHLSDLHFGQERSSIELDRDEDPRLEVLRDCARVKSELRGEVSGVLVSGDIAFSGDQDEYRRAASWFDDLCTTLDVPDENVWMVPGNHDFEQAAPTSLWRSACEQLRSCDPTDIDSVLTRHLDTVDREVLLRPLRAYYEFAGNYGCVPKGPVQVWEESFGLEGGLRLQVWGLNTALLADGTERSDGNGLVLGERAVQLPRDRDDETWILAMWHHPLRWLRDRELAARYLDSRAAIQLFGHEHCHRIEATESRLTVSAGALHPKRGAANWDPRYNIIEIEPVGTSRTDGLRVSVIPRRWNLKDTCFEDGGEGGIRESYVIGAEAAGADEEAEPEGRSDDVAIGAPVNASDDSYETDPSRSARGRIANRHRRLALRFSSLPYVKQLLIAGEFNLVEDQDRDAPGYEQPQAMLARAADRGLLAEIWDAVARESGANDMADNPYRV